VLGIGFARKYRPQIYGPGDRLCCFIHNAYLWVALKMGCLGLLPFLWLLLLTLGRGLRRWNAAGSGFTRAMALGSAVALAGVMLANVPAPYFMQDWGAAAVAVVLGTAQVALDAGRREETGAREEARS
jgi:O-antigen ligase